MLPLRVSAAPPVPAPHCALPSPPLDDNLHNFVRELFSPHFKYNIYLAPEIADDFLLRLRGMSTRIVTCKGLDPYFRAVYGFLLKKPKNERAHDRILRGFWEEYSLTSHQMVLDNACENLRVAEAEHQLAHIRYRSAILSSTRRGFTTQDDEYQQSIDTLQQTLKTVHACVRDCHVAANQCKFNVLHFETMLTFVPVSTVRFWGVYLAGGNCPLEENQTLWPVVRDPASDPHWY